MAFGGGRFSHLDEPLLANVLPMAVPPAVLATFTVSPRPPKKPSTRSTQICTGGPPSLTV